MEIRNNAVTKVKAIGIILMVLGHSLCPIYIRNFVDLFNMPLFFIMSGYCFKDEYVKNAKKYLIKN